MAHVKRITIVLAYWCPHCVPLSLENTRIMAADLKVPLRVLDIDFPEQEKIADSLVEKHGDYVEDYIIPQVFLEYEGSNIDHVFTGFSEGVSITAARWNDFLRSGFYRSLLRAQNEET